MSFGDRSQVTSVGANLLPNQRVPSGLSPTLNYSQSSNLNTTGYSSRTSTQVSNMRNNVGYTSMPSSHNNAYPLSPDVQFKKLPFYDVLGELLKPSTLGNYGQIIKFMFIKLVIRKLLVSVLFYVLKLSYFSYS